MTKTRKIALAMFSALLAISVSVSALFGFGVIKTSANAEPMPITMMGTALRLSEQPALGFYAELGSYDGAYTYGMLIVDSKDVEKNNITGNYHANFESNGINYKDVVCEPYENNKIRAATDDLPEALYYTRFMGIAYAKNANGNYTYASVNVADARSVVDVAVANYDELISDGNFTDVSKENLAEFYANVKDASGDKALIYDTVDTREETITVRTGESYTLTPDIIGEGEKEDVAYLSDNENVFTVEKQGVAGVITAHNPGEAYLRVRVGLDETLVKIIVSDEVSGSIFKDTFKAISLSSINYTISKNANIYHNIEDTGVGYAYGMFDGAGNENGYYTSDKVYFGINEFSLDMYVPKQTGWIGISFCDISTKRLSGNVSTNTWGGSSVYLTPFTISQNAVSVNASSDDYPVQMTKVNDVTFDLSKNWVNFKFVMESETAAQLYINGTLAYNITNYETLRNKDGNINAYRNFKTAKILVSTGAAVVAGSVKTEAEVPEDALYYWYDSKDKVYKYRNAKSYNDLYIDNVNIQAEGYKQLGYDSNKNEVYSNYTTSINVTEDFSQGPRYFVPYGQRVKFVSENGLVLGNDQRVGLDYFRFAGENYQVHQGNNLYNTWPENYLFAPAQSVDSFSVDARVIGAAGTYSGYISYGINSSNYYPLIRLASNAIEINAEVFSSYVGVENATYQLSGNKIFFDVTTWHTYKFVSTGADTVSLYIGAQGQEPILVANLTIAEKKNDKGEPIYPVSLTRSGAQLKLLRRAQNTTECKVTVDFANVKLVSGESVKIEDFSSYSLTNKDYTFTLLSSKGVGYCQDGKTKVEKEKAYSDYANSKNVLINKTYKINGGGTLLDLATSVAVTGDKVFAIKLSGDNEVISSVVFENGTAYILNATQNGVEKGNAVAISLSDIQLKVISGGEVKVYSNGAWLSLGTLSYFDGTIAFADYSGYGKVVIKNLTINGAINATVEYKEDADKQIVISAYSVLPADASVNWLDWDDGQLYAYLKTLRDAGFTTGMALQDGNFSAANNAEKAQILDMHMLRVLDMCEDLGIDYYVKDWILARLCSSSADISSSLQDLLTNIEYVYHNAYRGNVGSDEPGKKQMDRLAQIIDIIYGKNELGLVALGEYNMNLLPDYAQVYQLEDSYMSDADKVGKETIATPAQHQDYLNYYVEKLGKQLGYISMDYYPFYTETVTSGGIFNPTTTTKVALRSTYLTCLQRMANIAKANGLENRQYVQIDRANTSWTCTNPGEVTLQVYTHLAFGTTHLTYYVYESNCFDANHEPNKTVYEYVKTANTYVKALEKVLLQYTWEGVYHTEGSTQNTIIQTPESMPVDKTPFTAATSTVDTLYGIFNKGNGDQAVLAVNISLPTSGYTDVVNITFRNETKKAMIYYQDKVTVVDLTDNTLTYSIPAGEGIFVIPLA